LSEEKIDLQWIGNRLLTMTVEVRDMQSRLSALEARFSSLESRVSALETRLDRIDNRLDMIEQRMTSLVSLVVRIAERLDGGMPQ